MPYEKFDKDSLILRDELAIDRTRLANERTLLAYLRSAIALVIAGMTIIHFSGKIWYTVLGFTCIPAGFITCAIGIVRYRKMDRRIFPLRKDEDGKGAGGS